MPALPVLEIGGTHVTAALVDLEVGLVLSASLQRATLNPSGRSAELLGALISCGRGLPVQGGERWGVAIPGPFDYERGIGLFADVGKFESLYGVDVRGALSNGLPGPPGPIIFLNDADAFLWGEWLFGAAAGHERCVAITLGTGVGSAFIADGELRHDGPGVPPEGRADLLQIAGLPLEDVVSARAIERSYRERTGVVPRKRCFCRCPSPGRGPSGHCRAPFLLRATRPGPAPVAGGVRGQRPRHRGFDDRVLGPDRAGLVGGLAE